MSQGRYKVNPYTGKMDRMNAIEMDSIAYLAFSTERDSVRFHYINGDWSDWFLSRSKNLTYNLTLDENLAQGNVVQLTETGHIEGIGEVSYPKNIPSGLKKVFNSGNTDYTTIAFDPDNTGKFVVAYRDQENSSYGTAVVGEVSEGNISFGSEYVFNAASTAWVDLGFDSTNKICISYQDATNSGYGTAVIGDISGNTISFGDEYVFNAGTTIETDLAVNNGKLVISYKDVTNSNYGTAVVGDISGNTISFGSEYVFNAALTSYISIDFNSELSNKFTVVYRDHANSSYGTAIVGEVSGNTISFGNEYVFNSGSSYETTLAFSKTTSDKFVVTYTDSNDNGFVCVGSVSGTSISFGNPSGFSSVITYYTSIAYSPTSEKIILVYYDADNDLGISISGEVLDSSVSFDTPDTFNLGGVYDISVAFDNNLPGSFIVTFRDDSNLTYGTAIPGMIEFSETNLIAEKIVGILQESGTIGQTKPVLVIGVDDNQTSLLIGKDYYVQKDGTINTNSEAPAVKIGKAISNTAMSISPGFFKDSSLATISYVNDTFKPSGLSGQLQYNDNGAFKGVGQWINDTLKLNNIDWANNGFQFGDSTGLFDLTSKSAEIIANELGMDVDILINSGSFGELGKSLSLTAKQYLEIESEEELVISSDYVGIAADSSEFFAGGIHTRGFSISPSQFQIYDNRDQGLSYKEDYSSNNLSNPRWIVDKQYVDNANKNIKIPNNLTADHSFQGKTIEGTAGESLSFGDFLYFNFSDGKWWKANASDSSTSRCRAIAVSSIGENSQGMLLIEGVIRDDSWSFTDSPVWLSTTTGQATSIQPNLAGNQIQYIGMALNAVNLYFSPSQDISDI